MQGKNESKSRASLKDIAKAVGVDVSTVSRALNDSDLVRAPLRKEIKRVAEELQYVPNAYAYGLRKRTTSTVAIGLPSLSFATGGFNEEILRGVDSVFEKYDFVVCMTTIQIDKTGSFYRVVNEGRVDGALILGDTYAESEFSAINATNLPSIALNVALPHEYEYIGEVSPDYEYASELLAAHLIDVCRRSKFLYIGGGDQYQASVLRRESFIRACANHGVTIESFEGDFASIFESGEKAIAHFLRDGVFPFDAVLCASDYLAMGVIRCLTSHGITVGKDVAVVGYDNNWANDMISPPLTSINLFPYEMGIRGATALLEKLGVVPAGTATDHVHPALVVRASCGANPNYHARQ